MNLDPVGPVPVADANNRLVLSTDGATKANAIFAAVASCVIAVLTISFLYMRFVHGLPPRWDDRGLVYIGLIGTLFIPLAIYWTLVVLFPAQLEIDDEGLVYRARGRTTEIKWTALHKMSFEQVILPKSLNTKTLIRIAGGDRKIALIPNFGVSPAALADYIAAKQKSFGGGTKILWEGTIPQKEELP